MIEINIAGSVCVSGELSFTTVPGLNRRGCGFIKHKPDLIFDLAQVTFSDNAGVALLISWVRCAKRMGGKIVFVNLPQQLLDLVRASGVEALLPVKNNLTETISFRG